MAKKPIPLRFRQIHLDFHTGPWIDDVGVEFDPREFARTMKAAHVDSVTVFAKCHHGHLYYETDRAERHPGLAKGTRLLERQVEALHREGIRAPIYISVMCDEWAANQHPEWIAMMADGKHVGRGPLENRIMAWQILDMSSPYQDYLAEQTREVLRKFKPVDGIFFDMCWDQPSVSNFAKEAMERDGFDPEKEDDRNKHAHLVALRYMKRFSQIVRDVTPNASIFFNGRSHTFLREETAIQTQDEIEALPTGGWGYTYFPRHVRYARTLLLPYLGMTARFHKSWADFGGIKPYAALEYETSQMIAHGAKCSVGDQLHPRGTLDKAAYQLIGRVYGRVKEREPWLTDATVLTDIAVLQSIERPVGQGARINSGGAEVGAVRMLTSLKHQFDLVDALGEFEKYRVLVLPDAVEMDAGLVKKLRAYLKGGGSILASGVSGLNAEGTEVLLPQLPIKPGGAKGFSPFTTTYIRFGKEIAQDVPPTDHVMYETGVRVAAAAGSTTLARVVEPYFQRSWRHFSSHQQTPGAKLTNFPVAVQQGRVAYISYPIFSAFATHGNFPYRLLVRNILERLLPDPLLRVDGPTSTETSVMRQAGQGKRTIVHLLHYCPERRTEKLDLIEDVVPLFDVPMSLKLDLAPKKVYAAPEKKGIAFEYLAGRVNLRVPEVRGHAMIVFEG